MKYDWDTINARLIGHAKERGVEPEPDLELQPMSAYHEAEWRRHAAGMVRPVVRRIK